MVKINKEFWEDKAKAFNIDKKHLEDFPATDFIQDIIDKYYEDLDNIFYEFLTKNGYKIDKPYKIEQIEAIKEDLARQDKFVDTITIEDFDFANNIAKRTIIPFFNRISLPLLETEKQEIIKAWKENNK